MSRSPVEMRPNRHLKGPVADSWIDIERWVLDEWRLGG